MAAQVLSKMKDDTEKEHAFRGMAKMALVNPQVQNLSSLSHSYEPLEYFLASQIFMSVLDRCELLAQLCASRIVTSLSDRDEPFE